MIGPELEDYNHPPKLLLERLECLALRTTYETDLPFRVNYLLSCIRRGVDHQPLCNQLSVELDLKQFELEIEANAWSKVNNNTSKVKQC
ncbi:15643_t:CDS:2 [Dentiscutata erythropus]|uniref:15643_t:CDS:1 n=1 Tax=Dentiscutata erythropus TaxID=1348616 RepID=A0A9N9EKU5_9GLOM|nr:15643_t:CDS:2 [Dentiscutata erythropus]